VLDKFPGRLKTEYAIIIGCGAANQDFIDVYQLEILIRNRYDIANFAYPVAVYD
jgi:hypothetical protein